jgi:hypothetical protein
MFFTRMILCQKATVVFFVWAENFSLDNLPGILCLEENFFAENSLPYNFARKKILEAKNSSPELFFGVFIHRKILRRKVLR